MDRHGRLRIFERNTMNFEQTAFFAIATSISKQNQTLEQIDPMLSQLMDRTDVIATRLWQMERHGNAAIRLKQARAQKQAKKRRSTRKSPAAIHLAGKRA